MGVFARKPKTERTLQAQEDAPQFERVEWTKDPGLRKLAFFQFVLCIASATTGYDGLVGTPRHTIFSRLPICYASC